jgi:hypothetical protein
MGRGAFRCVLGRAALSAALLAVAAAPTAEVIDRILAVVSGSVITLSDVTAARDLGIVPKAAGPDDTGAVLDELIDRALMLVEVDRFSPPEPTAAAIDGGVAEIRGRFPSNDAFRQALAQSGVDDARLRELVREGLRLQVYLDLRFSVPPPTDQEVAEYYRDHQADFAVDGQVRAIELVRPQVAEAITASRRRALVDDWVAGLRRRADIINLYAAER